MQALTHFENALEAAVLSLTEGTYDMNNVMTKINTVKAECNGLDGNLKSVSQLLCCTERLCAVYTACFAVTKAEDDFSNELKAYCRDCVDIAVKVLECCHGLVFDNDRNNSDTDIPLSDIDRLMYHARALRPRVISRHKRIFSALSELERVDNACVILVRCKRLIDGCVRLSDRIRTSGEEISVQ